MIVEALEYLVTPAEAWARQSGLLTESIGLRQRYLRCKKHWQPHYAQCRQQIQWALSADVHQNQKVLILGAGLGKDIPLDWLSQHFAQVTLVDGVFLWPLRWRVKRYANVHLVSQDITASYAKMLKGVSHVATPHWGLDKGYHWVISLNLMGQLSYLPLRWYEHLSKAQRLQLEQDFVQKHLHYLASFPQSKVLLIADEQWRLQEGEKLNLLDPWAGVSHCPPQHHWNWTVAPWGEISPQEKLESQVGIWQWQNPSSTTLRTPWKSL